MTPFAGTFEPASESPLFNRVRKRFWIRGSPPGSCDVFGSSGFSARLRQSSRGALFVVVVGLAGAGKTEFLRLLARDGEQVLDLEALAGHRGSAFGGIGLEAQPSHAAFARAVAERVATADPRRALWVEDEGPFIGSVGVPPWLCGDIARAPVVELHAPFAARVARLSATYGTAPIHELLDALERSRRRLGADCTDAAIARLREGDVSGAIAIVLPWFDNAYHRRVAAFGPRQVLAIVEERSDVAAR